MYKVLILCMIAVFSTMAAEPVVSVHFCGDFSKYLKNSPLSPNVKFTMTKSTPAEISLLIKNGSLRMAITPFRPDVSHRWQCVKLAFRASILAVNPQNTLRNIPSEQARNLINDNIGSWRTFGGPAARIHLYIKAGDALPKPVMRSNHTHDLKSPSTIQEYRELRQKMKEKHPSVPVRYGVPLRLQTESDSKSFSFLFTDPKGLACFDITRYDEKRVPLLRIDGIPPTLDNFRSGSYPLMTTWYLTFPENPSAAEKRLIRYLSSMDFSIKLYQAGFLPVQQDKLFKK